MLPNNVCSSKTAHLQARPGVRSLKFEAFLEIMGGKVLFKMDN